MFNTDKFFWHNYVQFYETFFAGREFGKIAEIGLFKGDSVRWMLERFPASAIIGADILPIQDSWPVDDRFLACQLDQESVTQLAQFFELGPFDLIIEDGSHFPQHQINTLLTGIDSLTSNGIYILEDIHSSHPLNTSNKNPLTGNALSVLLGIKHYKEIDVEIDHERAELIAKDSLMTADNVLKLDQALSEIHLYRRTNLPRKCFSCNSSDYNFSTYTCTCGQAVFADSDSMTFVLVKK